MTDPVRSPTSLAWRLALTAVFLHLVYTALIQTYSLIGLPQFQQLRDMYSQPQFMAPLLANTAAAAVIIGLTVWGATHRWLVRNDTMAVNEPRKLFGTFIALMLLYMLALSAASAFLHSSLMAYVMANRTVLEGWTGFGVVGQFVILGIFIKIVVIVLNILGMWLVVRIAAWTVQPAGPAGGPTYGRRHAAWIAGLTVLAWQLVVAVIVGGYLQMQSLNAGWTQYLLGYLALPAILLVLCARVCLKVLPNPIGTARLGRAVTHGSLAFWLAQALGVGLGYLIVRGMSWSQLIRAAESSWTAVVMLLVYGALLALGCLIGSRALYRRAG